MPEICCSQASPSQIVEPNPTCGITGSADQQVLAQEPPAGCISTGEEEKALKGPFNQTLQTTLFLGP